MKKLLLFVFFIFFLSFQTAYAAEPWDTTGEVHVTANPNLVKAGESVGIDITDLPIARDKTYTNNLYLTIYDYSANPVKEILKGTISTDTSSCKETPGFTGDWKIDSCSQQENKRLHVIITVKTDNLAKERDTVYQVWLAGAQAGKPSFTVTTTSQSTAPFTITSVTPDPISPNQQITIKLNNTIKGTYKYEFQGDMSTWSGKQKTYEAECNLGSCVITESSPGYYGLFDSGFYNPTNPNVVLTITDPNNQKASITLNYQAKYDPLEEPKGQPPAPCGEPDSSGTFSCLTGFGIPISTNPQDFVKAIFQIILSISGGIALLLVIFSGYRMVMSRGNPEKIQEARDRLTSAIVGLLFIIFSLVILQIIGVDILHIPQFK
ncbi:MAG: hypothetical protein CO135_00330 [Candidatus Levybacteria bacterium CG_4_9_14_3_um_filter_35_16]|nr:MAG: hypothetical protein COW87_01140 [Candidatus Levybacteria bacterium CG22_combo_CG10-13_8_21_14_all_35_11]PIZ98938.1 MAG: hypothetical protein COX78_02540 [Candidatus Levybacteria bacterium CG_4_10_14_0_2_um_filter_35_8]PJA91613.1 MAG: hypothetical protein CO135_00330 [Candidatus Levybacteria bacterium CG_4_9_14_3_um_filter_35_16]